MQPVFNSLWLRPLIVKEIPEYPVCAMWDTSKNRQPKMLLSWNSHFSRVGKTCNDFFSDSVLEENRKEPRRQTGQNARKDEGLG